MVESDRSDFGTVIEALAATFSREATEALLTGYWLGLSDVPLAQVKRAVVAAMRTSRFMPSVAELRELSGELPLAVRTVKAWDVFERAVIEHGGYSSVCFDDPVINATIHQLGGWERCCETETQRFDVWLRKDFERVYAALCRSGVSRDRAGVLLGTFDRENNANGYALGPPALIATGLTPLPGIVRELPYTLNIGALPESVRTMLARPRLEAAR